MQNSDKQIKVPAYIVDMLTKANSKDNRDRYIVECFYNPNKKVKREISPIR